jgi:hypothetical protein
LVHPILSNAFGITLKSKGEEGFCVFSSMHLASTIALAHPTLSDALACFDLAHPILSNAFGITLTSKEVL